MAFQCPSCSETTADAFSKDEHQRIIRERVQSKDQELATVKRERDEATRKVMTADQRIERAEKVAVEAAYTQAGIPTDATIRRGFAMFYEAAMEGKPEGERPSLAEWVLSEEAKAHPMLSGHFAANREPPVSDPPADPATPPADPPADPAAPADPTQPASVTPPPTGDGNATDPPATDTKMTPEQLAAYFTSDEYRALPAEKQKEEFARLKAEAGLGTLFDSGPVVSSVLPQRTPS